MTTAVQETCVKFDEIYEHIRITSDIYEKKDPSVWNYVTANLSILRHFLQDFQKEYEENQKKIENPSMLTRLFFMKSLQQKQNEIEDGLVLMKESLDKLAIHSNPAL